MKTERHCR